MPNPIEAAGAVKNPTRYSALSMGGRQFTGLVTQRSPYRDGMVPYLAAKFESGSRFDTIWDGANREITQRLDDGRAPGSSTWNNNSFPAGNSFFSWKFIQNGSEKIRVLYDGVDGTIYDASNNGMVGLYGKTGPARFLSVNTELFFTAAQENKKILEGSVSWRANVNIQPGSLINQGGGAGTMYMALGGIALPIVATSGQAGGSGTFFIYVDPQNVPEQFPNLLNVEITFSGLTGPGAVLNGLTRPVHQILSTTLGIFSITGVTATTYAETPDTGQGSTGDGTTGATLPSFNATEFDLTTDAGQQWKSYGTAAQDWTPAAPTNSPTLVPQNGTRFWQPSTVFSFLYAILDTNGFVEVASTTTATAGGVYKTGRNYPTWVTNATQGFNTTIDGTIVWLNLGAIGAWASGQVFDATPIAGAVAVILDSNQNLQWAQVGGTSGGSVPTWATAVGSTTTDNTVVWTCLGPGVALAYKTTQYGYSYHAIDGSVSTSSPAAYIQGGILGPVSPNGRLTYLQVIGVPSTDTQVDYFDIWRTAQGQATLILEDQMPADGLTGTFTYNELGIPDTSAAGGGSLNPFIAAPVASANNPPPVGMTAPVYYQQRVWAIFENTVIHSGGPDTLVGNGNTAFAPLDEIPFASQPIKLFPVLVQNGGLMVLTTGGVKIILGTGTTTNPYYSADYLELVNLSGYNAACIAYNQIFMMESNGKVSSLAIEYPFNPQTGYTEVGFPIGDQFIQTTTGGVNAALFNPATAFVSWNMNSSGDTGMYVSDNAGHWFRLSLINPPESGMLWSPLRTIETGASAVQSVEVTPGNHLLLIAPRLGGGGAGPILQRDTTGTVWTDGGQEYPSWDAKGVTLLCSTGQWAEVAHISAKSKAVGKRPKVSILLGEIQPSPERPYNLLNLDQKSNDPPRIRKSLSAYSDRYVLAQKGMEKTGDCILVKFDYGTQAEGDVLWDWAIFATVHDEREEGVSK